MGSSLPSNQRGPRYVSYRSAHRAKSHDSAHSEEMAPDTGSQLDHPLVPAGAAALIQSEPELHQLLDHLRTAGRFGYDSEFIGELTYIPKLCLVQVASAQRIALIDPLAELDLHPFWELIADPKIEKIVHAGQQDLEPIVREIGKPPANVFDTQIAAGFIGLPYPLSLSKLVNETVGVKLGKGLTFTHWDQRPLSASQLRYAADDVRYLILAREKIGQRLNELGHAAWVDEECAAQCNADLFRFNPEQQYLKIRGSNALNPRNLAVLRELAIWRDGAAREADVPPRALLKDEILLEMARNPVKTVEKLDRVRGLPRPVEAEYGMKLVELTLHALSLPEQSLPVVKEIEPTPTEKFRTDSLWAVAQSLCTGQSIDVGAVTSRQEISDFYQRYASGRGNVPTHRLMTGWRYQAIGRTLSQILQGKARIELSWPNHFLRAQVFDGKE